MIKNTIITLIFISSSIYSEEMIVTARSGLILRSQPSRKSTKLATIPFGKIVNRIDNFKKEDPETYNNIDSESNLVYKYHHEYAWYKIRYNETTGYAYSYYLIENSVENNKYFLYDETQNNLRLKRDFHKYNNSDGSISYSFVSNFFTDDSLLFFLETPLYFNENVYIDQSVAYLNRPIEPSERQSYEGGFLPYFYSRIVKADLTKKDNLTDLLIISANSYESSIENSIKHVISIYYNNTLTRKYEIEVKDDQMPVFRFNNQNMKIKKSISNAFRCLNKYRNVPPNKIPKGFQYHQLFKFSFAEYFKVINDHKVNIKICNLDIEINFEENSIN
ncbi:hypothetical protein A0128_20420 [Leptospira tipperaryensis]|uniref:SH3b domain-containing protein n=1 Tax=Leptospira tipperaryensis TaxID=2564040 RepID=A0A1D7V3G7_9LEPT|nr:SH3 domain-containing protein [Leptospira tipperaryensis]AOP36384.1 hypothetical protein A0128_20420 [Leptospira tipperaryensis]